MTEAPGTRGCEQIEDLLGLLRVVEEFNADERFFARWWRGEAATLPAWRLVPKVFREPCSHGREYLLYQNFMLGAKTRYARCPPKGDNAGWLFLMQHYGLPTRLLDWSGSPLTALFFAVCDEGLALEHGTLWALKPELLNTHLCPWGGGGQIVYLPTDDEAEELFSSPFEFMTDGAQTEHIAAITPEQIDARMSAQISRFTIHAHANPLEAQPAAHEYLTRFEIPSSAKSTIRRQLHSLGIKRSILFPDLSALAQDCADGRQRQG